MGIFEIEGTPQFKRFVIMDTNPVSGRTKKRFLSNPNDAMRRLQRAVIQAFRRKNNRDCWGLYLKYATGAHRGNSSLSNVEPHRRNRFFYLLDFANAFKSVRVGALVEMLRDFEPFSLHPAEEVEKFVVEYFMDPRGGLSLGGNASTDLFNLYAGKYVDVRLFQILDASKITYTRYIDDLTFSSPYPITAAIRREIRQIVLDAGFWINHKKCEVVDLQKGTIVITGVGLENGGRVFVPRSYLRRVRGFAHRAETSEEIKSLYGMANFIANVSRANFSMRAIERKVLRECQSAINAHR